MYILKNRWQHTISSKVTSVKSIPETAVLWSTSSSTSWICRAQHHGAILAGATVVVNEANGAESVACDVGFVNKVHRKHKFDLLLNTAGAALLEWRPFAVFSVVPVGAVASADNGAAAAHAFVGRHSGPSGFLSG